MSSLTLFHRLLIVTAFSAAGCGQGSGRLNDSVPSGSIEAQAEFSGRNGNTVTGTALIYNTNPDHQRVLRLQDLNSPGKQRTDIVLVAGGVTVYQSLLRAPNGNMNYVLGTQDAKVWELVTLRLGTATTEPSSGAALFKAP